MAKILWIALGGALGSLMRYAVAGWGQRLTTTTFPLGTLIVNTLGCLAIGFLAALFAGPEGLRLREEHRLALMVGVLGGFTTFSTYAFETFSKADDRAFGQAAMNLLLSNALGLAAVWIGFRLAEHFYGGAAR